MTLPEPSIIYVILKEYVAITEEKFHFNWQLLSEAERKIFIFGLTEKLPNNIIEELCSQFEWFNETFEFIRNIRADAYSSLKKTDIIKKHIKH